MWIKQSRVTYCSVFFIWQGSLHDNITAVCQLKYIRLYKKSSLDQQDNGVSQFYEACEQSLLIQSEMLSNRSGL